MHDLLPWVGLAILAAAGLLVVSRVRTKRPEVPDVTGRLRIEPAYNHALGDEGAKSYRLETCRALEIDLSGFDPVPSPELGGRRPDRVQLVAGPGAVFERLWQGEDVLRLDEETLEPLGKVAFEGFVASESYMLSVGAPVVVDGRDGFAVAWVSIVNVVPGSD